MSLSSLQEELVGQQKLLDSTEAVVHAADNNTYQDIHKLKQLRLEAQRKMMELNQSIRGLERRIEALKRVEPQGSVEPQPPQPQAPQPHDDSAEGMWALSELLQALGARERDAEFYVTRGNALVELLRQHPKWRQDLELVAWGHRIQNLLLQGSREVAAMAFRLARYAVSDAASLRTLRALGIHHFVVASLAKDAVRFAVEREHALKLVRRFVEVPRGELPLGVLRALVAVAELPEDRLRKACLETLCEVAVLAPLAVAEAGGARVMAQVLREGPYDAAALVGAAFVHMLDTPAGQAVLHHDVGAFLSPFTDIQIRGHVNTERLQNAANVVARALKTWPGLAAFVRRGCRGVRDLLSCLVYDVPVLRDVVMDVVCDVLHIRPLPWTSAPHPEPCPMVSQYVALVLGVFWRCDLRALLLGVMRGADAVNRRKAAFVYAEVSILAARLGPGAFPEVEKSNNNPPNFPAHGLFKPEESPGHFNEGVELPIEETDFLCEGFESLYERTQLLITRPMNSSEPFSLGVPGVADTLAIEKMAREIQRPRGGVEAAAREAGRARARAMRDVGDLQFRQMLADTQVLTTKTYSRWNWDVLTQLMQGPLRHPRRYDEVLKTTKLFKRISSFFRPFKYRYSTIRAAPAHERYTALGREFLSMLLSFPEGIRTLAESKLLRQIAECLAQVDPHSGITAPEPLFLRLRLPGSMSAGYFAMLGELTVSGAGLAMLESWKFFSMFQHIVERTGREDLILYILRAVRYTHLEHLRALLAKAMATCGVAVRLEATALAVNLLDSAVGEWAARALVRQLYDPDVEVCECAARGLHAHVRASPESLDRVLRLGPSLEHLGRAARASQAVYLATPRGFRYLHAAGFVARELARWEATMAAAYAAAMARVLAAYASARAAPPLPPCFYAQLAATDEGCAVLRDSGVVARHLEALRAAPDASPDLAVSLWVLGNIGSTLPGVMMLEEHGAVAAIAAQFRRAHVSLRGVAFYAFGLLAQTEEGAEALDELGWYSAPPSSVALPRTLAQLFAVARAAPAPPAPPALEISDDPVIRAVLDRFKELGSYMRSERSTLRDVSQLKLRYPEVFSGPELLVWTLDMLERGHYRLGTRRTILEHFEPKVWEEMVRNRQR